MSKIQLTIANNFISFTDNYKKQVMHPKGDNIEIMINDEADEFRKKRFDSLKIDIKIIWNGLKVVNLS